MRGPVTETVDLVFDRRGSSAGPRPGSGPNTAASGAMLRAMMSWVSAVVWVMKQDTCGVVIAEVIMEKGTGSASPRCSSSTPQSMLRPSSRAGVPVLSRARASPAAASCAEKPCDGFSPRRPAGVVFSPMMDQAIEKGSRGEHDGGAGEGPAILAVTAESRPFFSVKPSAAPSITVRLGCWRISSCIAAR